MKKKIVFIFVIIMVILLAIYLYTFRTINISDNKYFKEIYKNENYENVKIRLSNSTEEYVDGDILKQILDILKNVNIKRVHQYEYDKMSMNDSYTIYVEQNGNSFIFTFGSDIIKINDKYYWTDRNLKELLSDIIKIDSQDGISNVIKVPVEKWVSNFEMVDETITGMQVRNTIIQYSNEKNVKIIVRNIPDIEDIEFFGNGYNLENLISKINSNYRFSVTFTKSEENYILYFDYVQ